MTCDNCGNKNESEFIYGRWIIYCEKCKESGKRKNQELFFDNECCNGERLDGLDGEANEMLLEMM